MILIIGTPDSGKSEKAENLFAKVHGLEKYYIATMIPYGQDGAKRVEKHKRMRAGKGFETIECPKDIGRLKNEINNSSACLLECMSNLAGNEMYDTSHSDWTQEKLVDYICDEVCSLDAHVEYLVVVSNEFPLTDESYDEETGNYVKLMHAVNEKLKSKAKVLEIIEDGEWKHYENI